MKVQRRTRSDVAPCCMCVAAVSRRTYRSHTHRHRRPDKPAGLYPIVVRFPIQIIDERVRKQSVAAHAAPAMCQIMPGARGDTPRQTSAGAEAHAVQSPCASNVAGAASASRTKVVGHPASALAHVLARAAAVCAGSSTPSTSNRRQIAANNSAERVTRHRGSAIQGRSPRPHQRLQPSPLLFPLFLLLFGTGGSLVTSHSHGNDCTRSNCDAPSSCDGQLFLHRLLSRTLFMQSSHQQENLRAAIQDGGCLESTSFERDSNCRS